MNRIIMSKVNLLLIVTFTLLSAQAFASAISIGPYLVDSDASATSASFSGSVFENVPGAITDQAENTYIKGTSDDAAVALGFENIALSNQSGNDLALFFITDTNTSSPVSLDINGINQSYTSSQLFVNPADPFVDIGEKYMVNNVQLSDGTLGIYDLSVIFIDLNEFGIGLEQSINSVSVNLGNSTSFMTYAVGLNAPVTTIPLPAPLILFLSGLTGLGFFSHIRRT